MLKGSAAMLTHWAGREKKREKRMVSPAGCSGSQGPAMAHIPFQKEDLRKPWSLGAKVGWPHFCLSCHLRRGFARSQSPGQICGSTMVKWGEGKEREKGFERQWHSGLQKPHDGQGGRQNRRSAATAPAAPQGAQLSPLPVHSINSSPLAD